MKSTQHFGLMAALAFSIFLGACSSTPVAPPAPKAEAPAPVPAPVASVAKPAVPVPVAPVAIAPYLDPSNAMSQKRSVYFDFDQYALKPEYMPVLEMHGKYLSTHPNFSIKVEGNTDEQGGAEYNLALGQKRAQAVVNALKIYGVKDSQMEAISFGKEKPKALGHDDAARAQNRRADLAYPAK